MILSAIIAKAIPYLIGLMALAGVYWRGKHNGAVKATRKVMDRYQKTRKAMDDVETGDDPDAAQRWLRERGK